ncbi:MAG: hypothetical protein ABRQ38_18590 [Candidatus Eremiobacterota bacterium]
MAEENIKDFTLKILEKLGGNFEFITSDILIATFKEPISSNIPSKLYLSFIPIPPEFAGGEYTFEPVLPGSDLLEELISIARKKGGRGKSIFLKASHTCDNDSLPVSFFSVAIESVERVFSYMPLMEFNFRVSFLTDEHIESIYSVLLEGKNSEVELDLNTITDYSYEPQEEFIYRNFPLNGEEAFEYASELVISKIKPQVKIIEEEQAKFLHNSLLRLESYYGKEREYAKKKYKEEASPVLEELTKELKQKKEELINKHAIKTAISLINFREIFIPALGFQCVISKDDRRKIIQFKKDLVRGKLFLPSCEACKKESRAFTVCSYEGHVLGNCCVKLCESCKKESCPICKPLNKCFICNEHICDDCGTLCQMCKKYYCYSKHSVKCLTCGEDFCNKCTVTCKKCSENFCKSHITTCYQCKDRFCYAHSYICHLCKKQVCMDHGSICAGCGKPCCNIHFTQCNLCHEHYCTECVKEINRKFFCKGCISLKKLDNTDEIGVIFSPHISKIKHIPVLKLRHWKKGITEKYFIFTASGFFNSYIFIIDRTSGNIVNYRASGFLKALKNIFGL